jgi:hypothetical protein
MKFSLADSRFPWRFIRRCHLLLFASLLIPLVSYAQDTPSGFFPGAINIYAGNSTNSTYSDGSVATNTSIGVPTAMATDSEGDVFLAISDAVFMVYQRKDGTVPPILAAITTSPGVGNIYRVVNATNTTTGCSSSSVAAASARFTGIIAMWFDASDNLYIADSGCYTVSEITQNSTTTTATSNVIAGIQYSQSSGGAVDNIKATSALLSYPNDVKTDSYGNVYIADSGNNVMLAIYAGSQPPQVLVAEHRSSDLTKGNIYTIAGTPGGFCSDPSVCTGTVAAKGSLLAYATSISVDTSGNVYILDWSAGMVRVIYAGVTEPPLLTAEGVAQSSLTAGDMYIVAGNNNVVNDSFTQCSASPCGDNGLAANIQFVSPAYMDVDASGNVYIDDYGEYAIRKIDSSGYVSTVAGIANPNQQPPAVGVGGGAATKTQMSQPLSIALGPNEDYLYIADGGYYIAWQVAAATPQTIIFPTLTSPVTYSATPIALGATVPSGLAVTYTVSSTSPATVSGSGMSGALNMTGAGTIAVTAAQAGGPVTSSGTTTYYAPAVSVTQDVTVSKATLTVTADSLNMIYGASVPTLTYSTSGWVSSADQSSSTVVTGTPALSTTVSSTKDSGTYSINIDCSSMSSSDYTFNCVSGTMTITGATAQSITFPAFSAVTYGHAAISLGASASSNLAVTYTVVRGPGTISGSTLTITGAGTIVVQASQNGNDTYAGATPQTQSLTVNPAPLTVTAPSPTYPYGTNITTALASTSPTITGWVGTDSSSLVSGSPAYTTSATSTSDPGPFTLGVAQGQLALASSAAANYTFTTFTPGTITITKASQTISYVAPTKVTYGDLPTITATSSAGLPVTGTVTGNLTAISSVTIPSSKNYTLEWNATGVGAATITLSQAGNTDYEAITTPVWSGTIGQAPLDITATSFSREQGAANPTFTYTIGTSASGAVGGFLNDDTDIPSVVSGIPVLTSTATQASSPGTYSIVIDTSAMTAANYYFVPINGTLTVTQAGSYVITANPSSLTITRGQSAQSIITITPSNGYQGTITLTCGTLPANVTCTVSPSTYTFTGNISGTSSENPAQGTITINTTARTVVGALPAKDSSMRLAGLMIPGAFVGLFLVFARKRIAKHSAIWSLCALLALGIGATLGLTSCGGSSVNTIANPGTTTITITGSGTTPSGSGTVTATVPLTVTIQ